MSVWSMIFLTFFDSLAYLVSPTYFFEKRRRFCFLKKTKEGKVTGIVQNKLNTEFEKSHFNAISHIADI